MNNKKRELILSGYGSGNENHASIALLKTSDDFEFYKELWTDMVENPSFLCTYHDICVAVREEETSGAVLCYQRVEDGYILKDELKLEAGALCHIVYQPKLETLYCSFYETGHIAAIKVKDYHFTSIQSFFRIEGETPDCLSRAHCLEIEPDGERVFVANIALDRIFIYDTKDGILEPNEKNTYLQLPKGVGPRHMKFHPVQSYLYVITEYSNEIFAYQYQKDSTKLHLINRYYTLPNGYTEKSFGSSLDITKDGRFLYAANRGADTIAVFDIKTDGSLVKIQDKSCGGNYPRHIALTKDDFGLMIANQNSNTIVIINVDQDNGNLQDEILKIPFHQPSYIEEL